MYTLRNNKEIESQVNDHLEIIKKVVLSKLKVKSIILIGTFSRGEGAIFISGKAAIPANDYDLYLIVDKQPDEKIIFELQRQSVKKIRNYILKRTKSKSLLREFNVDFKCLALKELKNLPATLRFYDMKDTKTLYGKDYTSLIPDYEKISLSEGLRLIFNEMSHVMEYSSNGKSDAKTNYFLSKAYLSIVTSFLIYKNDLSISILQKNKKIQKYKIPIKNFNKKLEKYTQIRLNPLKKGNFKQNFFEVQGDLEEYFKFYLSNFIRISENDGWIKISNKIKKQLYKKYYSAYLDYYIKKYVKINSPKILLNFLSFFVQYYFSYKFALHLRNLKKPYMKTFFKKDPGITIMATLPLLFFSINENGFDKNMMNEANKNLNTIINSQINTWESLRQKYSKIYKLYFWQKFI